jgi:3-oxoacyl-[acyl-carrier protein] reductase
MSLEGKYAIVTGAGRGIGKAIAGALAQRGCQVVVAERLAELGEATAQELTSAYGQRSISIPVDVSDLGSVKEMVEKALVEFGRIDILVNNAGVTRDNLIMRMEETDWDTVMDINLKGAWNSCKAIIRPMMKQRYGRIVNISSVSGLAGQMGQTNYSASKAGVIGLTKALAREVATRNITVNAVAPGFIPTALTVDLPGDLKEAILKATPMGRMGTPEEIAYAVVFFASDEASYITGQVLSVDGGMVMM